MGWRLSKVQLPVGVPERTRQYFGAAQRENGYDSAVVEDNHGIEKEVCFTAGQVLVEMHVTDWAKTQREDPVLNAVLDWLEA